MCYIRSGANRAGCRRRRRPLCGAKSAYKSNRCAMGALNKPPAWYDCQHNISHNNLSLSHRRAKCYKHIPRTEPSCRARAREFPERRWCSSSAHRKTVPFGLADERELNGRAFGPTGTTTAFSHPAEPSGRDNGEASASWRVHRESCVSHHPSAPESAPPTERTSSSDLHGDL